MTPYDNLDLALLIVRCKDEAEVLRVCQALREEVWEGIPVNLKLLRRRAFGK